MRLGTARLPSGLLVPRAGPAARAAPLPEHSPSSGQQWSPQHFSFLPQHFSPQHFSFLSQQWSSLQHFCLLPQQRPLQHASPFSQQRRSPHFLVFGGQCLQRPLWQRSPGGSTCRTAGLVAVAAVDGAAACAHVLPGAAAVLEVRIRALRALGTADPAALLLAGRAAQAFGSLEVPNRLLAAALSRIAAAHLVPGGAADRLPEGNRRGCTRPPAAPSRAAPGRRARWAGLSTNSPGGARRGCPQSTTREQRAADQLEGVGARDRLSGRARELVEQRAHRTVLKVQMRSPQRPTARVRPRRRPAWVSSSSKPNPRPLRLEWSRM